MQQKEITSFLKQRGVTLLEALLVLALMSMILIFAVRQYQQFKAQQDIQQLQLNIDRLFVALGRYYQAYCAKGSLLDPAHTPAPSNPTIITPASLVTQGFLDPNWNNISVPFVTTYYTQLNRNAITSQNVRGCYTTAAGVYTCGSYSALSPASVYTWRIQVAVALTSTANAQAYLNLTSANCLSETSGSGVNSCSDSSGSGTILVWERLPSFAAPEVNSNLWMSMPQLKIFNNQQTHDQMYELSYGADNYLCGG